MYVLVHVLSDLVVHVVHTYMYGTGTTRLCVYQYTCKNGQ